ncbi:hypothetical protein BC833DRAFT_657558, partial [Globomyces pollinis-pini]
EKSKKKNNENQYNDRYCNEVLFRNIKEDPSPSNHINTIVIVHTIPVTLLLHNVLVAIEFVRWNIVFRLL